jgi:ketosteroid isomerase-like protein
MAVQHEPRDDADGLADPRLPAPLRPDRASLERLYEALAEHHALADELLAEHAELVNMPPAPLAGSYPGRAGIARYLHQLFEEFSELCWLVDECTPAGPQRVLARVRAQGTGKGSGIRIEQSFHHLWTIEHGKVARIQFYSDATEARAAAGLAPEPT